MLCLAGSSPAAAGAVEPRPGSRLVAARAARLRAAHTPAHAHPGRAAGTYITLLALRLTNLENYNSIVTPSLIFRTYLAQRMQLPKWTLTLMVNIYRILTLTKLVKYRGKSITGMFIINQVNAKVQQVHVSCYVCVSDIRIQ